jgi:enoyl-CoA hydratase/carnithine racemase
MINLPDTLTAENRGGLLVITLARPQKANALSLEMNHGLAQLLRDAQNDTAVRGALITGAGERVFCAGVDVREASQLPQAEFRRARSQAFFGVLLALTDFDKPLVAAINGAASGGGLMIAALADAILAVEGAQFSLPEIDLGSPTLAALVVLEPWLGAAGAYDLVQTGRRMSVAEAERRGLVRAVLPREALFAQAEASARELIAKPARAFTASKAWLRKPLRAELERAEQAMVAWRAAGGET